MTWSCALKYRQFPSNAYPYVFDPNGERVPVPEDRRLHVAP